MNDHIICGFDGSVGSVEAANWAAAEATRRAAGLTLLACYIEPMVTDFAPAARFLSAVDTIALRDRTRARVDELAAQLSASWPGLAVTACALHARANRALVEQGAKADLLVLGATGSSETSSPFMGSVVRSVVRNSPCPVVVVSAARPVGEVPRVVVGTDGTRHSAAALDWAIDECDLLRGQLDVVHAYSYPYDRVDESSDVARDLLRIDAATHLERAVERAQERGGSKVEGHLAFGSPADVIRQQGEGADLVVIGMRHYEPHSLYLAVLGSVAEKVVSKPPCPVAVVHEAADRD
jgi:nucleotide-binding universal stress UspA family protein